MAAANYGNNSSGAMAVAAERDLPGTDRRHKGNVGGNVRTEAAVMAATEEADDNESLSNISSEITAQ